MAVQSNAVDIHLRSSAAMNLSATTPFSVTVWINANWNLGTRTSFVGIYGPITDVPLDPPVTAMQIGTAAGDGSLSFWTWGGGLLTGTAAGFLTADNGVWIHISYTYDGTTHRGYRNGVLATFSTTLQTAGFLNQVYINGYPGGATSEIASYQVDQYSLFRRALSADEIQTMYFASGARHGITNSLVARYEYDELAQAAAVTNVIDLSGNGHTLTPTGPGAAMTYTYPATLANSNIRPVQ